MDGFDLSAAKPVAAKEDEGQTVHVHSELGEPLYYDGGKPVTMTVVGTYSSTYRRAEEALSNQRLKRRSRAALTAGVIRAESRSVLAACVLAWDGFMDGGKPLACTKENVVRVLEAAPWIEDQVTAAMEDHAGFFSNSSAS